MAFSCEECHPSSQRNRRTCEGPESPPTNRNNIVRYGTLLSFLSFYCPPSLVVLLLVVTTIGELSPLTAVYSVLARKSCSKSSPSTRHKRALGGNGNGSSREKCIDKTWPALEILGTSSRLADMVAGPSYDRQTNICGENWKFYANLWVSLLSFEQDFIWFLYMGNLKPPESKQKNKIRTLRRITAPSKPNKTWCESFWSTFHTVKVVGPIDFVHVLSSCFFAYPHKHTHTHITLEKLNRRTHPFFLRSIFTRNNYSRMSSTLPKWWTIITIWCSGWPLQR